MTSSKKGQSYHRKIRTEAYNAGHTNGWREGYEYGLQTACDRLERIIKNEESA